MSAMADSSEEKPFMQKHVLKTCFRLERINNSCEWKDIIDNNIIFYVAGIIAHNVTSNVRCHYCKELFIASNGASTMGLEDDGSSDLTSQECHLVKLPSSKVTEELLHPH